MLRADAHEAAVLLGGPAREREVLAAAPALLDAGPRLLAFALADGGDLFVWRDGHELVPHAAGGHELVPNAAGEHELVPNAADGHELIPHAAGEHELVPNAAGGHELVPHAAGEHELVPNAASGHELVTHAGGEAVDTTGGGDALTAALTAALLDGATPREAAREAVAAAGRVVTHAGGRPGLTPRRRSA
ncbi:PfkB family carbohydrate kinase [Dactylosporangium sp. NPDC049742]|uniref:PfkB family carbohydrate kinase n=1 Tax=Dactylosporangium sp. NPDC049742 TaxID=3154737 RepID=UPI00342FEABB